jgi:predicted dehydrogenase
VKKIGIGIIGTGSIASDCHAPAVKSVDGAFLAAVMSRTNEKAKGFAEKHGNEVTKIYSNVEEFLADPAVQLVIICVPDKLHYEFAEKCLRSGKHVLLEKPMTTDIEQAVSLSTIAKENALVLYTGFHLRHHNGHKKVKELIGQMGTLRHMRATWSFPQPDDSNWRAHAQLGRWWSLAAVGSHCVDLMRWYGNNQDDYYKLNVLFDSSKWGGEHDEKAVISGQFSKGATFEVMCSVQYGPKSSLEVYADEGIVECEDTFGRFGVGEIIMNGEKVKFKAESPFTNQLEYVIGLIGNGYSDPVTNIGVRNTIDLITIENKARND